MKSAEIDEQPATKCSLNEQKQQPGAASASHVCPPSEGEREERWTSGKCVFISESQFPVSGKWVSTRGGVKIYFCVKRAKMQ